MKLPSISSGILRFSKSSFPLFLLAIFFASQSQAQIMYSRFVNPVNKYELSYPYGVLCLLPGVTNGSYVSDSSLSNYASVTGLLTAGLICTGNEYAIKASLALPTGTTSIPAGMYAGFKVQFNSLLSLSVLTSNLSMRTYLGNTLQETTSGSSLLGLSLLALSTDPGTISFKTTKPFDAIEVSMNTSLIAADVAFDYRFYFAYASMTQTLPVKLVSMSAQNTANSVNVKWVTASEINAERFDVERSVADENNFVRVGTVSANGDSGKEITYNFTDQSPATGKSSYRLKIIDKDGRYEYSKIVSVNISGQTGWKIFPTKVNSGAQINATASSSGNLQLQLINSQGGVMRSISTKGINATITTANLPAGIYILKASRNGQTESTERILIY